MNSISPKKLQVWTLRLGVVLLVLGVVCLIGRHMVIQDLADFIGSDLKVKQVRIALEEAENFAAMMGTSVAEVLGVSAFHVLLLRFSLTFGTPLLVLGIAGVLVGVLLKRWDEHPEEMEKAKQEFSKGMGVMSARVKDAVDKATIKCPSCGKISVGKTAFCSSCGTKLPEPAAETETSAQVSESEQTVKQK